MYRAIWIFLSAILTWTCFPLALDTINLIPTQVSAALVWISFVPVIWVVRNLPPGPSFRWGYAFGFLSNTGILFWILIAMKKYGGLSTLTSTSILLVLIMELALYPALTFWVQARLRGIGPSWAIGTLMFTLLEWTRVYFPIGGFPWATPAYALYGAQTLLQGLDLIGTTGFNVLIFASNFLIVEALDRIRRNKKWPQKEIAVFSVLILSLFVYGGIRKNHFHKKNNRKEPLRFALIQGNIEQDQKWKRGSRRKIIHTYQRLSMESLKIKPHIIVWPEAAIPQTLPKEIQNLPFVFPYLGSSDLVAGIPTYERKNGKKYYLNSAFVISPSGKIRLRYDKQHLVPFGEYVPFSDILPMHYIVPPVAGDFSEGGEPELVQIKGEPFGILICYEVLFPDLSIDQVQKGATFLVNITNDAWFDHTSGPYQHAQFGAFRAIETRRPILRSANTGITTWFDVTGTMHSPTRLFEEATVTGEIIPNDELTFYVRYHQLIPLLSALLLLVVVSGAMKRQDS